MAVYEDSDRLAIRPPSNISIAAYHVADFVDQMTIALRRYIIRTQTERALSQLSDRQLDDIGFNRSRIAEISADTARRWGG